MNVTVENLAPCKKLLRVEVDPQEVDKMFEVVAKDFQRQVTLPGFRPGKAPKDMVLKRYEREVEDEAKRKLISESYKKAVDEQKIDVLGHPDIEEIQFGRGKTLQFAATVETSPEFELPEYVGIPARIEQNEVREEDVTKAIQQLREKQAKFEKVGRPLQTGDVAVVNYKGTTEDGKPLTDLAPTAQGITTQQGFWVEIGGQTFIPGFAEQLVGAVAGDKKTLTVDFPAEFVSRELAGKRGIYEVEVVEVRQKDVPPEDDNLAKAYEAENLEKLKQGVRDDLKRELEFANSKRIRNQIIRSLLNRVTFELPETAVARETRNVVYDLVQENAKRGVSRQMIEQEKDRIYSAATEGAKERVKVAFLLQKIAEKEDIKVSQEEISQRVHTLASMYQIPVNKFVKDLQKRGGVIEIYDQIMNEKVMQRLEKDAKIDVGPAETPR